jgi:hypothetical protein
MWFYLYSFAIGNEAWVGCTPPPPPPTYCFSAVSCARIFHPLLLVDSRALQEMMALAGSHIQEAGL